MDDAHDDIVHDREISKQSFDYVIWEAKRRLNVSVGLMCVSFVGIFVSLGVFDPPESIAGATLCGFAAITPITLALLNRESHQSPRKQDGEASDEPAEEH